jgi:hypothetical protein
MSHVFRCEHVRVDYDLNEHIDRITVLGTVSSGGRDEPIKIITSNRETAQLFVTPGVLVLNVEHGHPREGT